MGSTQLIDLDHPQSLVRDTYSSVAQSPPPEKYSRDVASSFGYGEDALKSIPEGANMGLSCGNPTAVAGLKKGEVVVDLGSGGGLDVFLASKQVGPTGQSIGIDFSKDMIELATRNAQRQGGYENVRFEYSPITKLPLADDSVDCVLSNCVINLVPHGEKPDAINEIARILRPGGRVHISDIVAKKELPEQVLKDAASYVGCISGAIEISVYREMLENSGLTDIKFTDTNSDLEVYKTAAGGGSACCGNGSGCGSADSVIGGMSTSLSYDLNDFVGSYQIYAVKPTRK